MLCYSLHHINQTEISSIQQKDMMQSKIKVTREVLNIPNLEV